MAALPSLLPQWPAGVTYHGGGAAGGTPGDNVECTSELCQLRSTFWGIYPLAPHLSLAEGCV